MSEPDKPKGDPKCPVCKGDGYFFAPRVRGREVYMYCDCEANIRERVSVTSDCFRHGPYSDAVFCPTCEKEAGR